MRKSNKEAAQTREAIVAAAADHIRRTGIAEASLADVMAAAGLTHGGFYRHFRNKEHLVAEAFSAAGDKTVATISRTMSKGGVNAAVDSYLSTSHRDAPTPICPLAALGSEVARSGGPKPRRRRFWKSCSSLSLTVGPDPRHEVMRSSPSPR